MVQVCAHNQTFDIPSVTTVRMGQSSLRLNIDHRTFIWNSLPYYMKNTGSLGLFKSRDFKSYIRIWTPNDFLYGMRKICLMVLDIKKCPRWIHQRPHFVKSVEIRSFYWSVFSCIWTEYRKIRTRKISVFGHFTQYSFFLQASVRNGY